MKKTVNKLFLFFISVISLFLLSSSSVEAFTVKNDYYPINNQNSLQSLGIGNLAITNITFDNKNLDKYGLIFDTYNGANRGVTYRFVAKFYDYNYQLIARIDGSKTIDANQSEKTSILPNDINNTTYKDEEYNIDDIYYYTLDIDVPESYLMLDIRNDNQYFNNGDYVINSYDVNITVNENNTLLISEKIGVYFNVNKHGIFRKIPIINQVKRLDGSTSRNRVRISDIMVSEQYTTYNENGFKVIKIGDPNVTLTGQQYYTISYLYDLGKDPGKDFDELYCNIIGDSWDTKISDVTFTITMPKEFDHSKLGFSSGVKDSIDSSRIIYKIDGNTITGSYEGTLFPNEALTVRLTLPEGYFVGVRSNTGSMTIISLLLPIVLAVISFLIWLKYGRDEPVIETIEFYPPEGLNSLDTAFFYKGKVNNKDITSLLIYLANKGYIKISETEEKPLFLKKGSKGFKITKLKDYDGNNENERLFLTGLFKNDKDVNFMKIFKIRRQAKENGEAITYAEAARRAAASIEKDTVTADDLYDNFYKTMSKIRVNVNSSQNKSLIFEKSPIIKKVYMVLMIIFTFFIISYQPVMEYYGDFVHIIVSTAFSVIGFMVVVNVFANESSIASKIIVIFWWLIFSGSVFFTIVMPAILVEVLYLITYIIGLSSIIFMTVLFYLMPKRNKYGNEMLGKIRGFKTFLEIAEKEKLEAMVMQNPNYFYDILPYTYILGISDKWIKKFETISLQAPNWYDSSTDFNVSNFSSFMNSTVRSAEKAMSSSPSSSSSGGSSGGGSAGGGSGGGGGGSW